MMQVFNMVGFDDSTVMHRYERIYDYTIADGYVYILTLQNEVYGSCNSSGWWFIDALDGG